MKKDDVTYIEQTQEGAYRVVGTRVGLEQVVHGYLDGQDAEMIHSNFPSLSLEMINGAIAFYLDHRKEVDRYIKCLAASYEELRQKSEKENAALLARLRAARRNVSAN